MKHGKGTFTWLDGGKFEGFYEYNKRIGFGEHTWANGEKYIGMYVDDKKHD